MSRSYVPDEYGHTAVNVPGLVNNDPTSSLRTDAPPQDSFATRMRAMLSEADRNLDELITSDSMAGSIASGGRSERSISSDGDTVDECPREKCDDQMSSGSSVVADKGRKQDSKRLRQGHADLRAKVAQLQTKLAMTQNDARTHSHLMQEKVDHAGHRNLMLQQKMAALEAGHRDEIREINQRTTEDLGTLRLRLEEMESKNPTHRQLMSKLITSISQVNEMPSAGEYARLCSVAASRLSLEDHVKIQIFELSKPMMSRLTETDAQLASVLAVEKQLRLEFNASQSRLAELETTLMQIKNVDRRVAKLDDLELQVKTFQKHNNLLQDSVDGLEAKLAVAMQTNEDKQIALSAMTQQHEMIKLDKQHLVFVNQDLKTSVEHFKDQTKQLQASVRDLEGKRDEAYERLLKSQQEQAVDFDRRLHVEIDNIREKNNLELMELRNSAKQLYEQESRGYQHERDAANAARNRTEIDSKHTQEQLDVLQASFRQLELSSETSASDLRSSLKVKTFEADRTQILLDESQANLKFANLELRKQQDKIQVVTKEFLELKSTTDVRIGLLQSRTSEDRDALKSYQHLEHELDDIVMQAAQADDSDVAMMGYGDNNNSPVSAKRRLKQSVLMARKLLAAQKQFNTQKIETKNWQEKHDQVTHELKKANELLEQASQPYNYLIDGMRSRELLLTQNEKTITRLQQQITALENEKKELMQVKNKMSVDLEHLLGHDDEITSLRQLVQGLLQSQYSKSGQSTSASSGVNHTVLSKPTTTTRGFKNTTKPMLIEGQGQPTDRWN